MKNLYMSKKPVPLRRISKFSYFENLMFNKKKL